MKLQWALLKINFLPITWSCNIYSLTPLQNISCSPIFQNFKQCISWVMIFLCCDIPTVPLEYTTGAQIFPINAQIHCSSYKWQLHVSATQQPSGCLCGKYKRNFIPAAYIQLIMISGRRYLSLTHKGIWLLHGKSVHNIKGNV